MDNKITYHAQNDIDNTLKLREVLKTLPPFCRDYFRAIDATTTTKTRISYAYDIRIFFQFLLDQNPMFKDKNMSDFTVDVLDQIKAVDLEEYEEFLKVYKSADSSKTETNGERGVKRKISALRSFYAYYYKHEMITTNPSVLIDVPKIHEKNIIRLDTDEVAMLLEYIEHCGDTLTGQKRMYHEKTWILAFYLLPDSRRRRNVHGIQKTGNQYYVLILGCLCHRSMYRNGLACVPDSDYLVLQFL